MALALLLSAAKCIVPIDRKFRNNDWSPRYQPNPSVLLHGKTALILGYGAIGKRVARSCLALGMDVQATRRTLQAREVDNLGVTIHPAASLFDLLSGADALVVCLPLTEETEGLLDMTALTSLPQGAIVVNVARGPIIQAEALFQALKTGHLHAAGLDVWYNYPKDEDERSETPPSDLPFAELENVVMSPHRAGGSRENVLVRAKALAALLEGEMEGDRTSNRVDLEAGY
jgi:phosphoglycerate dehydrogenase-like enzyme